MVDPALRSTASAAPHVLLVGDFHPAQLGASYKRGLEAVGCPVSVVDVRAQSDHLAPWLRARVPHRLTRTSLRARRAGSAAWNKHVLQTAKTVRPDLAFVLNGDLLMPETVRALREAETRVFIFHADNPLPPHSASRPEHLASALETDCYFVWSHSLRARLLALGVTRVEYLPFAWDPAVFPHVETRVEPAYDVVFVGGWDRQREALLSRVAERFDLKVWGPPYWRSRTLPGSPTRRCWQGGDIRGDEAARVLARARVSLNIMREQNLPDGTNMRTFEVPGAGGFSLSTRTSGALDVFPEGQGGAYFADADECIEQIERFLKEDQQRRRMAEYAHDTVERGNQYIHRARQIIDMYAGL